MEKGNNTVALLIDAFVCLFLGLALIGVVANETNIKADPVATNNYLLNINSAKSGSGTTNPSIEFKIADLTEPLTTWRASDGVCDYTAVDATLVITNGTVTLVKNTDYKYSATNGSLTFQNTVGVNQTKSNNTYVSYAACADDYVAGWAGNMLLLVPGFFALALLGCSIALFYSAAKINGVF